MLRGRSLTLQQDGWLLVRFDVIDNVFDSLDFFSFVVGNFDIEFLFKSHDKLYNVKAISAKIFYEFRILFDLISANAQLLYYNLFNVIQKCHYSSCYKNKIGKLYHT